MEFGFALGNDKAALPVFFALDHHQNAAAIEYPQRTIRIIVLS